MLDGSQWTGNHVQGVAHGRRPWTPASLDSRLREDILSAFFFVPRSFQLSYDPVCTLLFHLTRIQMFAKSFANLRNGFCSLYWKISSDWMGVLAMSGLGEFLCVELKRSLSSMLPWDIPWYDPSHVIFFSALYGALTVIGFGVAAAAFMTIKRLKQGDGGHH